MALWETLDQAGQEVKANWAMEIVIASPTSGPVPAKDKEVWDIFKVFLQARKLSYRLNYITIRLHLWAEIIQGLRMKKKRKKNFFLYEGHRFLQRTLNYMASDPGQLQAINP